jgi:hypothetical protein
VTGWTKIKGGAPYAGVSVRTFRSWLKQGLKHVRLPSGTILVRYGDIDEFLQTFEVRDDQVSTLVTEIEKSFLEDLHHE